MKSVWAVIFFVLLAGGAHAQNAIIDSLKVRISQAPTDVDRIDLRVTLINTFRVVNLDSALTEGRKVVMDARKIGYRKGEANAMNSIASAVIMKGDFETGRAYLDSTMAIASNIEDSFIVAGVYGNFGVMYGMKSKYDSSIEFFSKSLQIHLARHDTIFIGRCYGNMAIGYQMQSNFPQALLYQQKALTIARELGNESSEAYALLNMGLIYDKIGDSRRAIEELEKAVDFAKRREMKNIVVYAYTNLASLYTVKKDWEKTYDYAIRAAYLGKEMGDLPIEASSYSKAAVALANMGQYEKAKAMINSAMPDADSSGQPLIVCQLKTAMGHTLMLEGEYRKAIPYYETCLDTYQNTDEYDESMGNVFKELSYVYEQTGNYKGALTCFKFYATVIDSVRNKDKVQKTTELNMNYEFQKKEAAAAAEQAVKDAAVERARTRQHYIMALLGLVLLAVVVIAVMQYRSKRNKHRANQLLQRQKQKVEDTLSELKSTQAQLIQSEKMAGLGELTAGIAHEIQNPLNFVNNFSEVSRELLEEMKEELDQGDTAEAKAMADAVIDNLGKIRNHGRRADSIVKGMLQHSRTGTGSKESTDINALADEYLRLAYHGRRAKDKEFNVTILTEFDPSIGKISVVPQDVGRVILNLINNAFYAVNDKKRHSDENYKPEVVVITEKVGGNVVMRVRDNAMGIPEGLLKKIFQPFFTTKPTGQGTGLGLSLSYDIMKAQGGDLHVESEEGRGSTFSILFPISTAS